MSVCDKQSIEQYRKSKKHDPRILKFMIGLLMVSKKMIGNANHVDEKNNLTHYPRTLQSMKSLSILQNMKLMCEQ